jgi:hypothetical protein
MVQTTADGTTNHGRTGRHARSTSTSNHCHNSDSALEKSWAVAMASHGEEEEDVLILANKKQRSWVSTEAGAEAEGDAQPAEVAPPFPVVHMVRPACVCRRRRRGCRARPCD